MPDLQMLMKLTKDINPTISDAEAKRQAEQLMITEKERPGSIKSLQNFRDVMVKDRESTATIHTKEELKPLIKLAKDLKPSISDVEAEKQAIGLARVKKENPEKIKALEEIRNSMLKERATTQTRHEAEKKKAMRPGRKGH